MSQETIMMQWSQLRKLVSTAKENKDNSLLDVVNTDLLELQEYMKNKGYEITTNRVISPEGETIWESS